MGCEQSTETRQAGPASASSGRTSHAGPTTGAGRNRPTTRTEPIAPGEERGKRASTVHSGPTGSATTAGPSRSASGLSTGSSPGQMPSRRLTMPLTHRSGDDSAGGGPGSSPLPSSSSGDDKDNGGGGGAACTPVGASLPAVASSSIPREVFTEPRPTNHFDTIPLPPVVLSSGGDTSHDGSPKAAAANGNSNSSPPVFRTSMGQHTKTDAAQAAEEYQHHIQAKCEAEEAMAARLKLEFFDPIRPLDSFNVSHRALLGRCWDRRAPEVTPISFVHSMLALQAGEDAGAVCVGCGAPTGRPGHFSNGNNGVTNITMSINTNHNTTYSNGGSGGGDAGSGHVLCPHCQHGVGEAYGGGGNGNGNGGTPYGAATSPLRSLNAGTRHNGVASPNSSSGLAPPQQQQQAVAIRGVPRRSHWFTVSSVSANIGSVMSPTGTAGSSPSGHGSLYLGLTTPRTDGSGGGGGGPRSSTFNSAGSPTNPARLAFPTVRASSAAAAIAAEAYRTLTRRFPVWPSLADITGMPLSGRVELANLLMACNSRYYGIKPAHAFRLSAEEALESEQEPAAAFLRRRGLGPARGVHVARWNRVEFFRPSFLSLTQAVAKTEGATRLTPTTAAGYITAGGPWAAPISPMRRGGVRVASPDRDQRQSGSYGENPLNNCLNTNNTNNHQRPMDASSSVASSPRGRAVLPPRQRSSNLSFIGQHLIVAGVNASFARHPAANLGSPLGVNLNGAHIHNNSGSSGGNSCGGGGGHLHPRYSASRPETAAHTGCLASTGPRCQQPQQQQRDLAFPDDSVTCLVLEVPSSRLLSLEGLPRSAAAIFRNSAPGRGLHMPVTPVRSASVNSRSFPAGVAVPRSPSPTPAASAAFPNVLPVDGNTTLGPSTGGPAMIALSVSCFSASIDPFHHGEGHYTRYPVDVDSCKASARRDYGEGVVTDIMYGGVMIIECSSVAAVSHLLDLLRGMHWGECHSPAAIVGDVKRLFKQYAEKEKKARRDRRSAKTAAATAAGGSTTTTTTDDATAAAAEDAAMESFRYRVSRRIGGRPMRDAVELKQISVFLGDDALVEQSQTLTVPPLSQQQQQQSKGSGDPSPSPHSGSSFCASPNGQYAAGLPVIDGHGGHVDPDVTAAFSRVASAWVTLPAISAVLRTWGTHLLQSPEYAQPVSFFLQRFAGIAPVLLHTSSTAAGGHDHHHNATSAAAATAAGAGGSSGSSYYGGGGGGGGSPSYDSRSDPTAAHGVCPAGAVGDLSLYERAVDVYGSHPPQQRSSSALAGAGARGGEAGSPDQQQALHDDGGDEDPDASLLAHLPPKKRISKFNRFYASLPASEATSPMELGGSGDPSPGGGGSGCLLPGTSRESPDLSPRAGPPLGGGKSWSCETLPHLAQTPHDGDGSAPQSMYPPGARDFPVRQMPRANTDTFSAMPSPNVGDDDQDDDASPTSSAADHHHHHHNGGGGPDDVLSTTTGGSNGTPTGPPNCVQNTTFAFVHPPPQQQRQPSTGSSSKGTGMPPPPSPTAVPGAIVVSAASADPLASTSRPRVIVKRRTSISGSGGTPRSSVTRRNSEVNLSPLLRNETSNSMSFSRPTAKNTPTVSPRSTAKDKRAGKSGASGGGAAAAPAALTRPPSLHSLQPLSPHAVGTAAAAASAPAMAAATALEEREHQWQIAALEAKAQQLELVEMQGARWRAEAQRERALDELHALRHGLLPHTAAADLDLTLLYLRTALFEPEDLPGSRVYLNQPDWLPMLAALWTSPGNTVRAVEVTAPLSCYDLPKLGIVAGLLHHRHAAGPLQELQFNAAHLMGAPAATGASSLGSGDGGGPARNDSTLGRQGSGRGGGEGLKPKCSKKGKNGGGAKAFFDRLWGKRKERADPEGGGDDTPLAFAPSDSSFTAALGAGSHSPPFYVGPHQARDTLWTLLVSLAENATHPAFVLRLSGFPTELPVKDVERVTREEAEENWCALVAVAPALAHHNHNSHHHPRTGSGGISARTRSAHSLADFFGIPRRTTSALADIPNTTTKTFRTRKASLNLDSFVVSTTITDAHSPDGSPGGKGKRTGSNNCDVSATGRGSPDSAPAAGSLEDSAMLSAVQTYATFSMGPSFAETGTARGGNNPLSNNSFPPHQQHSRRGSATIVAASLPRGSGKKKGKDKDKEVDSGGGTVKTHVHVVAATKPWSHPEAQALICPFYTLLFHSCAELPREEVALNDAAVAGGGGYLSNPFVGHYHNDCAFTHNNADFYIPPTRQRRLAELQRKADAQYRAAQKAAEAVANPPPHSQESNMGDRSGGNTAADESARPRPMTPMELPPILAPSRTSSGVARKGNITTDEDAANNGSDRRAAHGRDGAYRPWGMSRLCLAHSAVIGLKSAAEEEAVFTEEAARLRRHSDEIWGVLRRATHVFNKTAAAGGGSGNIGSSANFASGADLEGLGDGFKPLRAIILER